MSDASAEGLAPVTYLPWVTSRDEVSSGPSSSAPAAPAPGPDGSRGRGRGHSRPRPVTNGARGAKTAGGADTGADDPAPEETGIERDERIDRLVVSRLRRSALSVAEVRSVLVEHGLDEIEVEEWLERYGRYGYLDDARLAEQLVHSHGARRGRGSGAILHELSRRGIEPAVARAAVDDLDPEAERENATAVAVRRARQLSGLDRATAERRLSAFLQRRGYAGEVVREAVTTALAAHDS